MNDQDDTHHRSASLSGGISGWFALDKGPAIRSPVTQMHRRFSIGSNTGQENLWKRKFSASSMSTVNDEPDDTVMPSPVGRRLSMGARAMNDVMHKPSGSPPATSPTAAIYDFGARPFEDPFKKAPEYRQRRHSMACPSMDPISRMEAVPKLEPLLKRPPSPTSERILAGDFTHGF